MRKDLKSWAGSIRLAVMLMAAIPQGSESQRREYCGIFSAECRNQELVLPLANGRWVGENGGMPTPDHAASILDLPQVSGNYFFPQDRSIDDPFIVEVQGARLHCFHRIVAPQNLTLVHFHGNGEVVADYVPNVADELATLGLNSLFVEYRQYGGSTGQAHLVAMLGDGEAGSTGLFDVFAKCTVWLRGVEVGRR